MTSGLEPIAEVIGAELSEPRWRGAFPVITEWRRVRDDDWDEVHMVSAFQSVEMLFARDGDTLRLWSVFVNPRLTRLDLLSFRGMFGFAEDTDFPAIDALYGAPTGAGTHRDLADRHAQTWRTYALRADVELWVGRASGAVDLAIVQRPLALKRRRS